MSPNSPTSRPSLPISFPLSKFSYATVLEGTTAPIPWTHISSKGGLSAVFQIAPEQDPQGLGQDRRMFKVVNGTEVMVKGGKIPDCGQLT
jgi:hypothetical protein